MQMIKHHLPPGLDINYGDEVNGWRLSFIEPRVQTALFPRVMKENEVPDHYFFILVRKIKETGKLSSIPGFVPYEYLFNNDFSVFLTECIEKMEGRL